MPESLDRMYLNVYIPRLQHERGVVGFFRFHCGYPFASSALMEPISKAFIRALEVVAAREHVLLLTFAPGQRKDAVMAAHLARVVPASLDGGPLRAAFDRLEREVDAWCTQAKLVA